MWNIAGGSPRRAAPTWLSPCSVAAEANETSGQLVARWRSEWLEPRREQLRAVEPRAHQPCRVMAWVSKQVLTYLVSRDPADDPGSLECLHTRRLRRPCLAHELPDSADRNGKPSVRDALGETNRPEGTESGRPGTSDGGIRQFKGRRILITAGRPAAAAVCARCRLGPSVHLV